MFITSLSHSGTGNCWPLHFTKVSMAGLVVIWRKIFIVNMKRKSPHTVSVQGLFKKIQLVGDGELLDAYHLQIIWRNWSHFARWQSGFFNNLTGCIFHISDFEVANLNLLDTMVFTECWEVLNNNNRLIDHSMVHIVIFAVFIKWMRDYVKRVCGISNYIINQHFPRSIDWLIIDQIAFLHGELRSSFMNLHTWSTTGSAVYLFSSS